MVASSAGNLWADGPARRPRHEAEVALPVEPIDLVDHAVDVVRELTAARTDLAVIPEAARRRPRPRRSPGRCASRSHAVPAGSRCAARAPSSLRSRPRRRKTGRASAAAVIAGSSWRRLPAAALRGFANVFSPRAALARVQRCEGTAGHEDLAPRLEHGRPVLAAQLDRHRADRPHVDGDVLAPRAVAAGGSLHEAALLVAQRDREAVDLGLGRVGDLLHVEPFPRAPVEVEDVLLAECVVEREHRHRVHDLAELARRLASHALRGRIGIRKLRDDPSRAAAARASARRTARPEFPDRRGRSNGSCGSRSARAARGSVSPLRGTSAWRGLRPDRRCVRTRALPRAACPRAGR